MTQTRRLTKSQSKKVFEGEIFLTRARSWIHLKLRENSMSQMLNFRLWSFSSRKIYVWQMLPRVVNCKRKQSSCYGYDRHKNVSHKFWLDHKPKKVISDLLNNAMKKITSEKALDVHLLNGFPTIFWFLSYVSLKGTYGAKKDFKGLKTFELVWQVWFLARQSSRVWSSWCMKLNRVHHLRALHCW